MPTVLQRVKKEYLQRTYDMKEWKDAEDFLQQLSRKSGRLLKGGEADVRTVSLKILQDWQRGRLPYFAEPPEAPVSNKTAEQEILAVCSQHVPAAVSLTSSSRSRSSASWVRRSSSRRRTSGPS